MEKIRFDGPAGQIEGVYESNTQAPSFLLVIGHPHPLYGGTMDNKVVTTLSRLARDRDAAALRFNFRGVGASQGSFDNAEGERGDMLAAIQWLRCRHPHTPLYLAGFSFGSYVAASAAVELASQGIAVERLLLVAPPVHHYPFAELDQPGCPVWLVQGDEDEVVPPEDVFQWAAQSAWQPQVHRMEGAGHFFHGRLVELKTLAGAVLPGA